MSSRIKIPSVRVAIKYRKLKRELAFNIIIIVLFFLNNVKQ